MNYKSLALLLNLWVVFAFADSSIEQSVAVLPVGPVVEVVAPKIYIPGIDAQRVMDKSEKYKQLINATIRNKRIAWLSGGVLASGCVLYLLTDGFSSAQTPEIKKNSISQKKRSEYADDVFLQWCEEEQKKRATIWGASRQGIADGCKIALVSVVVGLLLKVFDNATNSVSSFSDNILGCDEDVLFDRVNKSVVFSFDCMTNSVHTLVSELKVLSSENATTPKIPLFFYDAAMIDLQALSLQLEEHMGLVLAIASLYGKDGRSIGQAMDVLILSIDDAFAYIMFLQQQGATVDYQFVKREALILEKKIFLAMERYLMTSKSVLFESV